MHKMTSAQAEQRLADLAEQCAQWRQQRTVNHAEYCGVRADAQRQRKHHNHSEARVFRQVAQRVAHILPE